MKALPALLVAVCLCGAAGAQAPPVEGEVVDGFELVNDRTVYFEPAADGRIRILRVIDKSRGMPIPKMAGQIGVGMTFAQEIGAVVEFNSGLDHAFSYKAGVVTPGAGSEVVKPLEVCPIGKGLVGAEQWPMPYARIVISDVTRHDGPWPERC